MRPDLFINGQWRSGRGPAFQSFDPASGAVVWSGNAADEADIAEANHAARLAFKAWSREPLEARIAIVQAFAKVVESRAAEFAETISRDMGKPLWDSRAEVAAMVGKIPLSIRAQSERAGVRDDAAPFGRMQLAHRAHGVLAVFGPFNFPGHLPNGHIVPALLAGNAVLFKPSELAPAVGALMAEAWEAAGLPPGVFNLLQGGRDTGGAILDADMLSGVLFTGSANAGAHIHRHFAGRPDVLLALELGGNNPLIVWPEANLEAAANLIAHSSFITSGQRCSCARRVIVPNDHYGDLVSDAVAELAKKIAPAAWNATPEPFMGPLISANAGAAVEQFEQDLVARGARQIVPVKRTEAFVHPAVLDVTGVAAPDEECFGPLVQIIRAESFDDALDIANATRFGLAGGLISDAPELWARAQQEMRAGILNWNRPTTGASGAMPFGGPGLSGSLRPSAYYAADYAAYPVATQAAESARKIPAPGLPE